MKRRILSSLMALVLVFGLLPATAFAEGETASTAKKIYVDAINGDDTAGDGTTADKAYQSIGVAVKAANSGDTIQLAAGCYSLYEVCGKNDKSNSKEYTKNKDLTFIGAGPEETKWGIGAKVPDPTYFGTEYNGDYSFDGAGTITFQNMTLQSGSADYLGFIRADNTVVENCTINGKTFYWGYTSAMFRNTTFNCPNMQILGLTLTDYAIWTYCSPVMTFDHCTFNSYGKVINVYNENSAADYTINFNNCTVNSSNPDSLSVMNINDKLVKGFTINFTGTNKVTGIKADGIKSTDGSHASPAKDLSTGDTVAKTSEQATCSKLFEFNMKHGNGNNGKTTVNIDGKTVWKDGKMVSHAIDTDYDKYTDGYKDDAFTVDKGALTTNPDGSQSRVVTKTCNYCGYKEETTEYEPIVWDVSKSKIATQLDTNTWTSDVTLSLPSAEENLASDVVFVLDGSSSASPDVVNKSLYLLGQLKKDADDSGAAVNVCVVKFKRRAYKSVWFDLSKEFDAIQTAMGKEYSGGTNLHAGLLAGQEALKEHTNVAAGRKYLILVSDGSTYLYSKDGDWASDTPFTRTYYTKENYTKSAGGYWDNGHYEPNNYPKVNVTRPKETSDPAAWQAYLEDVEKRNAESNGDAYDYHCDYDLNFKQGTPSADFKSQPREPRTANNRDMAFYYADQVWQEMKDAGYNAYAIVTQDSMAGDENSKDSYCFMNYLNEGKILDFAAIQKEILFAVSAGSTVTDTIGEKFTLDGVDDVDSFALKVGKKEINGVKDASNENTVNFGEKKADGKYPYTVTYTPATKTFVWTINEDVSNFAPVQLTYTVKLSEPETTPGTHGVEDLNGEKKLSNAEAEKALFTNESAVLNAKNSAGVPVEEQVFPKPSVSYTISSGTGGDDGDDDDFFAIQKVDAQDGHALNGATFELYQLDKNGKVVNRSVTKTRQQSSKNGIALFSVDNKTSYDGIWYYAEVTAPEGYVLDSTEHKIKAANFSDSRSTAVQNAVTVRNYRGTTPDLLNDSDHFAYVIGYMDGNVRPYGLISRAETTTIFFRLLKDSVRDDNLLTSNTYTDVADDYWANTAISTMTGLGIVQGRSTTTFDPKAPITRAQFAAICARFDTGKSSGTQTFTDIKGHWAEKYIQRAAELGWIKGFEDGTFRPDTYITRAQAMTMINRVLNRIPEDESDLLPGMNVWPDCNPGDWFYLAVQEATNSHDFKHKAGNYEIWTELTKNPDWTRYEH